MNDVELKSSQQHLSQCWDQAQGSADTAVFDQLVPSIVSDYGDALTAMNAHEKDDYPLLRQRDLFILRETSKVLPQLRDPTLSGAGLSNIMQHLNTLEGKDAFFDLVSSKFDHEKMTGPLRSVQAQVTSQQRQQWNDRFGFPPAITADEYAASAPIPAERPTPPISPNFLQRMGLVPPSPER